MLCPSNQYGASVSAICMLTLPAVSAVQYEAVTMQRTVACYVSSWIKVNMTFLQKSCSGFFAQSEI